jgi:hypothetical protein
MVTIHSIRCTQNKHIYKHRFYFYMRIYGPSILSPTHHHLQWYSYLLNTWYHHHSACVQYSCVRASRQLGSCRTMAWGGLGDKAWNVATAAAVACPAPRRCFQRCCRRRRARRPAPAPSPESASCGRPRAPSAAGGLTNRVRADGERDSGVDV